MVALFAVAAFGLWKRHNAARPEAGSAVVAEPARASPLSEEQAQKLKRETEIEFKSADANRDGFLSPDEVRGRFPVIAREFQRVDKDGDGRISPQEFFQARRVMLERKLGKQAE